MSEQFTPEQVEQFEGLINRLLGNGKPLPGQQGWFMALAWKVRDLERQLAEKRDSYELR